MVSGSLLPTLLMWCSFQSLASGRHGITEITRVDHELTIRSPSRSPGSLGPSSHGEVFVPLTAWKSLWRPCSEHWTLSPWDNAMSLAPWISPWLWHHHCAMKPKVCQFGNVGWTRPLTWPTWVKDHSSTIYDYILAPVFSHFFVKDAFSQQQS